MNSGAKQTTAIRGLLDSLVREGKTRLERVFAQARRVWSRDAPNNDGFDLHCRRSEFNGFDRWADTDRCADTRGHFPR